jgi:hypothetical protein
MRIPHNGDHCAFPRSLDTLCRIELTGANQCIDDRTMPDRAENDRIARAVEGCDDPRCRARHIAHIACKGSCDQTQCLRIPGRDIQGRRIAALRDEEAARRCGKTQLDLLGSLGWRLRESRRCRNNENSAGKGEAGL